MEHIFSRTEMLIGKDCMEILKKSQVAVIGIGGVGSFTVEALARAGIGTLILVDADIICPSNINRQIHALHSTIGLPKVDVMKDRILDINPDAKVIGIQEFYSSKNATDILTRHFDYLVDAIDSLMSKVDLIMNCKKLNIPVVSAMGAGNKIDSTKLEVTDISCTSVCPMARKVRKELRKNGIENGVKVVYSTERPLKNVSKSGIYYHKNNKPDILKKDTLGSISFVPSVMGLIIANEVVCDLLKI
ncbi:MAG: tRNA threonylcarbamoyladenosine dehydratase [Tepidanaerobacteraceae bacterium]|nr:tRNA threonylcarbamoyladenosine dehydratase [Tepidanaerobacteraceae bacterium]